MIGSILLCQTMTDECYSFCLNIYFKKPPNLRDCRSLHPLKVVIAIRKTVLKVKCFNDALALDSKGEICNISRTLGKSHPGTSLTLTFLSLKIPLNESDDIRMLTN